MVECFSVAIERELLTNAAQSIMDEGCLIFLRLITGGDGS